MNIKLYLLEKVAVSVNPVRAARMLTRGRVHQTPTIGRFSNLANRVIRSGAEKVSRWGNIGRTIATPIIQQFNNSPLTGKEAILYSILGIPPFTFGPLGPALIGRGFGIIPQIIRTRRFRKELKTLAASGKKFSRRGLIRRLRSMKNVNLGEMAALPDYHNVRSQIQGLLRR